MNPNVVTIINCAFCWSVVLLAIGGYLVTLRRLKEKWPFWIILASGWTLLAGFETLLASGISIGDIQTNTVWLVSYLLVMASLLLIFLKFVQIKAGS
jgi:hypothetical protein